MDAVSLVQGSLARAEELGWPLVLAMDVSGAFDHLRLEHNATEQEERGATATQIAAVLRACGGRGHILASPRQPVLGCECSRDCVKLRRTGLDLWNMISGPLERAKAAVEQSLSPAVPWREDFTEWGVVVWADNVFVLSSEWRGAAERAQEIGRALAAIGLSFSFGCWRPSAIAMQHQRQGPPWGRGNSWPGLACHL